MAFLNLIVATIVAYKAVRFISSSLRGSHPVSVDSSNNDVVPNPMASSSSPPPTEHDVFLSFRGEDTRDNFTSHLRKELSRTKIQTFIDDRLEKGKEISPDLLEKIEKSEIYVIIFSKDYASSTWCLDELVKILECKEKYGRVVIPVFYNVDPSNIRKQSGTFKNSFIKHEQRFKNEKDKVQRWKNALTQAANLSGWNSITIRSESKLVEEIAKDVLKKLDGSSSYSSEGLVGIGHHILQMEELLALESSEVRVVGIWGMGGIGKTTLAKALFQKLEGNFESCSFVAIAQEQKTKTGMGKLLKKCLSKLLDSTDIGTYDIRSSYVKNRLQRKKILLVLDEVDNYIRAEDLIKLRDCFGQGSRIIITSRDMQVLKNAEAYITYHVQGMDFNEAVELFSLKAFRQKEPPKLFAELSKQVVNYCQGIPLALIVLGCFLQDRRKEEWKIDLENLKRAPHADIFDVLKISFEGLNDSQQNIFLDLACFIWKRHCFINVDHVRNYFGFSFDIDISVLVERSLILVEGGVILMHDLVGAMGREIACQQSRSEPTKYIRLLKHEDIYDVFRNNKGTERIHGICLDMSSIKKINLKANAFQHMYNMRFLEFDKSSRCGPSNLCLSEGLDYLPEELRILHWEDFSLPYIPLHFCAENLVDLRMPNSHVQKLWDGEQHFPSLKRFYLSCKHLIELPDLYQMPNIEYIHLDESKNLVEVHSSTILPKIGKLVMHGCNNRWSLNFSDGDNNGVSLGYTIVYNCFDLEISSLIKMTIKVFTFDTGKISSFEFNVKCIPITKILRAIDTSERAELKLLGQCLDSLLPFVNKLSWLDIPVEFGNFGNSFEISRYLLHHLAGNRKTIQWIVYMMQPEIIESGQSLMQPCMKGSTTKEVALSLEQQRDHQNLVEVESHNYNRLTRVPKSISRWSLLIDLSLQKSDIGSLTWSIPGLSTLKSIVECDSTWLQSKIDLTFSMNMRMADLGSIMFARCDDHQFFFNRSGFALAFFEDWGKDKYRNLFDQTII